jgi:heme/copper-type cytochrome/quinol oxidase subunit 1
MIASPPIDYWANATYFLVAHFHYVLGGGSMFAALAAVYYWFPKITGVTLRETWGRLNFWLIFIGFNATFWPMHWLGLWGMQRRTVTYPDLPHWGTLNLISSVGAAVMFVGVLVFLWNLWVSLRWRVPAGDNPWDGFTLEWATTSPPPEFNFERLPPIRSERPVWDFHHPATSAP